MTTIKEIPIDEIEVGDRYRRDVGDITDLARSIDEIGLLHPIVIQDGMVIVVGSGNSSNSVRLVEVALEAGAGSSYRVDSAHEIDPTWFDDAMTVGVTSGASVPDVLVDEVIELLKNLGFGTVEEVTTAEETLMFALPPELRRDLKAASAEASANASS